MTTTKKISELPSAVTPLAGDEIMPIVQDGATRRATIDEIREGPPGFRLCRPCLLAVSGWRARLDGGWCLQHQPSLALRACHGPGGSWCDCRAQDLAGSRARRSIIRS